VGGVRKSRSAAPPARHRADYRRLGRRFKAEVAAGSPRRERVGRRAGTPPASRLLDAPVSGTERSQECPCPPRTRRARRAAPFDFAQGVPSRVEGRRWPTAPRWKGRRLSRSRRRAVATRLEAPPLPMKRLETIEYTTNATSLPVTMPRSVRRRIAFAIRDIDRISNRKIATPPTSHAVGRQLRRRPTLHPDPRLERLFSLFFLIGTHITWPDSTGCRIIDSALLLLALLVRE
jgi:hypothetical protein